MSKLIYKNDCAVFTFSYQAAIDCLSARINKYNVKQDADLLQWLQKQSACGRKDICISKTSLKKNKCLNRLFPLIKELLLNRQGDVFCKSCRETIPISELKVKSCTPAGYYQSVTRDTIEAIRKEFGLRSFGPVNLGGSGGTQFSCARGHQLFSSLDWII
ncbi:MAG TPA: hypothetical protein P5294_07150 [Smithellaceae bacterium]|nr:hypothetical protein [Smithellaceae bacterium]HRS89246.1 hypothetical protein [Smithellaceae bacterium]HRV26296.1 hypothetical protein [Smithellaceae bacterium]